MKRIILTLLLCFIFMSFQESETNHITRAPEEKDLSFLTGELNDSTLYLALQYYEIKYPKIVLAQAKLETGNYRSKLCKQGNNLFGLYNSRRKRYYTFDHWTNSIEAYKNMIEYKHKDGEDYYAFISRIGYAEDPNYVRKVKQIVSTIQISQS